MASYVGKCAVVSGTTGTTRTCDLSTISGWTPRKYDMVIMHVALSYAGASSATISMGAGEGWALMPNGSQSTGSAYLFANYYKIWGRTGQTDNLSTVVTVSGASKWSIIAEVFSSPSGQWDPTTPIETSNFSIVNSSPTTTMTCPAVTSGGTARTGIGIALSCDNNSNGGTTTNGWVKAISAGDVNVNSGSGYSLCSVYKDAIGSGSVATSTITQTANGADNYVVWTYLLVQGPTPPEVYSTLIAAGGWLQAGASENPGTTIFAGGCLETVWSKIPDPGAAPWSRGYHRPIAIDQKAADYSWLQINLDVAFVQIDASTVTVTITGDYLADDNSWRTHQFASFVVDYATAKDWIGIGAHVANSSTQDVISVWYVLGTTVYGPFTDTIVFTDLSAVLTSTSLLDITTPNINMDGTAGGGSQPTASYYNWRVVVGATVPSNATIYSMLSTPAISWTGAIGDYLLRNIAGVTALTDLSGNGRTAILSGTTTSQGPIAPAFAVAGATINASAAGATAAVTAGQSIPASVSASAAGSTAAVVATQRTPAVVSTTAGAATSGVVATQLTPASASASAAGATCAMAATQAAASVVVASAAAATATAGATQITPIAIAASAAGATCSVVASTVANGATVNANAGAATAAASATQVTSVAVAATVAGATASAAAGQTHSVAVLASAGASTAAVVAGQQCALAVVAVAGAATASSTATQVIAATINASAAGATCAMAASPGLVGAVVTAFAAGATCAASATQITATTVNASAGAATCSAVASQSTGATVAASCAGATASISATQVTHAAVTATCAAATMGAVFDHGAPTVAINAFAAGATSQIAAGQQHPLAILAYCGGVTCAIAADSGTELIVLTWLAETIVADSSVTGTIRA